MYLPDTLIHPPPRPAHPPHQLRDNHGRVITCLRLAITDRCNLRCNYCMPKKGMVLTRHEELLTYEEMTRMVEVFLETGVNKVRITGGEPFARKGCFKFLKSLKSNVNVEHLFITTNGVETAHYLDQLSDIRISGINLSIDSLERSRFNAITGKDRLKEVLNTMYGALERNIPLKINSVVTSKTLDEDLVHLANLTKKYSLQVRFIECMPFSGGRNKSIFKKESLDIRLKRLFPSMSESLSQPLSTARLFNIPGFIGKIGIIGGHSRSFCSTCDKVRITPQGILKNCLYDNGVLDLKTMMRDGVKDYELIGMIRQCLWNRHANGFVAEENNLSAIEPSMSSIGG